MKKVKLDKLGYLAFFFSGICAMSSGVIVSLLQEQYGFAYGMTGTLLSVMNIGKLIARLLIAFVFPIRDRFKALAVMGIGCVVLYGGLMFSSTGAMAIVMLFCFAFSMAGVNPTGVAGAGNMLSNTSVGVMLPVAGIGGILMPMIIGFVADRVSLQAGMMCSIVPCVGIFVFSILCRRAEKEQDDRKNNGNNGKLWTVKTDSV